MSWPSSFVGGPIAAGFNDVDPDQAGWTITLPDATLAATGTDVIINNISLYTFNILKNDNTFLYTLNPGDIIDFKVYDVSTAAGWAVTNAGSPKIAKMRQARMSGEKGDASPAPSGSSRCHP